MKRILIFILGIIPFIAQAQTSLSNNIQLNTPKPVDNRTGIFQSGTWRPYASVSAANAAINVAYRYNGLTVAVGTPTVFTEYWYYGGTSDGNLIPKPSTPLSGNTASRPSSPYTAQQYFNTDIPGFQYWNGSTWVNFSSSSSLAQLATPTSNLFTAGDGQGTQTFSDVSNEISYYVRLATNIGMTANLQTSILPANTVTKTWAGLTNGTTYYTDVIALADNINYSNSNSSSVSSGTPVAAGGLDTNWVNKYIFAQGNSILAGLDASNVSNDSTYWNIWVYQKKQALNQRTAIGGSRLVHGDSVTYACSNNVFPKSGYDNWNSGYALAMSAFGTNEVLFNYPSLTADSFETYLVAWADSLHNHSWPYNRIAHQSLPWLKDNPVAYCSTPGVPANSYRIQDFVTATYNAAARRNSIFLDLYTAMKNAPNLNTFFTGGETIHPNVAGHKFIADFLYGASYTPVVTNPKLYRPWPLSASANVSSVDLHWPAINHATSYDVVYSTSSSFTSPTTVNSSDTTETIGGLTNGTPYYFKVVAKASNYINSDYDSTSATPIAGGGAERIIWKDQINVDTTTTYNRIQGTFGGSWACVARSTRALNGAGYFEFTHHALDGLVGLTQNVPVNNGTFSDIDIMIYGANGGYPYSWFFAGAGNGNVPGANAVDGDIIKLETEPTGTSIKIYVNGVLRETKSVSYTFPLALTMKMSTTSHYFQDCTVSGTIVNTP